MKKLNNRGWGLNTFITFLSVFVIFIFIVVILSYKLSNENNENIISNNSINNYINTKMTNY